MVASSSATSATRLLLLLPQLWPFCAAFVFVHPGRGSTYHRSCRPSPSRAGSSWAAARAGAGSPAVQYQQELQRPSSGCRCQPLLADNGTDQGGSGEHVARSGGGGGGGGRGRAARRTNTRRRSRLRLQARSNEEIDPENEVIDVELSDDIREIVKADQRSKGKPRQESLEEEAAPRKSPTKKKAAKKGPGTAPSPAPGPFAFAGSGFASLEDAAASGEFEDLSGGRNSCLKRVEEAGLEDDGNPAKGSKIKVHYKMKVLGGDNIASSGEDRTKPFEFRLGQWPSEATHGWDKALSAMRKGEVATLICGPQYAFGESGAPPKIPPNATVETRLELAGWLDLAAEYNAVPGKVETDDELRERWSEDLAEGTSPMKDEAGLNKKLQAEMATKAGTTPQNTDHRGKKIYDLNSKEAREILAKQKVQGYTPDFGYVEKAGFLDLYIPVPEGTRAKDVTVEIHPDRMLVVVQGKGVVTKGHFQGKVALDGCHWLMSDLSLDPPGLTSLGTQDDEVRRGPVYRGETCVQVYLEKMKPFDTLWETVYRPPEAADGDADGERGNAPRDGPAERNSGAVAGARKN